MRGGTGERFPPYLSLTVKGNASRGALIHLLSPLGETLRDLSAWISDPSQMTEPRGGTVPPVPPLRLAQARARCPDCGAVAWSGSPLIHRHRPPCKFDPTRQGDTDG